MVSRSAALIRRELRRAWRTLAFKHHPDRGGDVSAFQDINIAYDILIRSLDAPNACDMTAAPHSKKGTAARKGGYQASNRQDRSAERTRHQAQFIGTAHLLQRFSTAWATLPLYAQTVAIETIGFAVLYNRNSLFGLDGSAVSFVGLLIILAGVIRAASRIVTGFQILPAVTWLAARFPDLTRRAVPDTGITDDVVTAARSPEPPGRSSRQPRRG